MAVDLDDDNKDVAMLIEALATRDSDPVSRFIASLPNEPPHHMRAYAEDTVRMRSELISNMQRALTCTDPIESSRYAAWIQKHVYEITYRWTVLMRSVTKWCELEMPQGYVIRAR